MADTIYLVKKDRKGTDGETEFIQMNGREFYDFIHSPEGEGRYFIHLTDDISYEAVEIYIEAGYEEFHVWKREENHHQYLMSCAKEIRVISADIHTKVGGEAIIATIKDERHCIEDTIVTKDETERLRNVISKLKADERRLLEIMYFGERVQTEAETAKILGISRDAVKRRKKKVFAKIAKLMSS